MNVTGIARGIVASLEDARSLTRAALSDLHEGDAYAAVGKAQEAIEPAYAAFNAAADLVGAGVNAGTLRNQAAHAASYLDYALEIDPGHNPKRAVELLRSHLENAEHYAGVGIDLGRTPLGRVGSTAGDVVETEAPRNVFVDGVELDSLGNEVGSSGWVGHGGDRFDGFDGGFERGSFSGFDDFGAADTGGHVL